VNKIAVLGCGPAGLLAAWAVEQTGHEPNIISRKEKSIIPGSVYLHRRVPDLTAVYPENHVQYIRLGNEQDYARKVYGDASRATGWQNYFQRYPSWNAVKAYDKLWNHFENRIVDRHLDFEKMREIVLGHVRTITTLPAPATCFHPEHKFDGAGYWIKTLPVPPLDVNKDLVVYNGLPGDLWYRWSVLSGVCSVESTHPLWADEDPDVTMGTKATSNTCDCWNSNLVVKAGRWAEWRHGVLLNDAYDTAFEAAREVS
jgi:hypothetical protein